MSDDQQMWEEASEVMNEMHHAMDLLDKALKHVEEFKAKYNITREQLYDHFCESKI